MAYGIPVQVLRGGRSRGAYFVGSDLPSDPAERDRLLPRLLDWPGPLAGRVAVVERTTEGVDYRFLRVDGTTVTEPRPCTDLLAGVGPFAVERGLVAADGGTTAVRVHMPATGVDVTVHVRTPGGRPAYAGDTVVSGVPGTAARLLLEFGDAVLPTGRVADDLDGVPVTLVDNGVPVALADASALGVTGHETPARLEYDERLRHRVGRLRRLAADLLGAEPEMCLLAAPADGGSLATRTVRPHRVHTAIGLRAAVGVGAAATLPGSVAARLLRVADRAVVPRDVLRLEHPTGFLDVVPGSSAVSSARLVLDGRLFC
ncbi:4-oxalomesaconate tautomerase [Actinoplanes sichuanensis]|uniref:PrpF domain-containing protein n=1 Tax=Actinoplanes sichuanensis TaxID=512349 RepID=A0ABW4AHA8_9ACTN|nr:PrpF domain-containing protein [Actinoplanes sichuanensis]BEL02429.1 4-oxalomesaconate tautomerase [Actinoplanes sichuanensis]